MPLFGSRRRAASNPPRYSSTLAANPTPSAASAATLAFVNNQKTQGNGALSAAAAAAALRSHTTSPVPVGQVQTKRMMRRGSNTSVSSSRPGLERRGSSSSMTERTFRSSSPGGSNLDSSAVRRSDNVPPVPAIPNSVQGQYTGKSSHRRAASLEPTARVSSPPPRATHGRGQSLDRGPRGAPTIAKPAPAPSTPASPATSTATKASPTSAAKGAARLAQITELEREASQRSVNFSRPMSPGPSPGPRTNGAATSAAKLSSDTARPSGDMSDSTTQLEAPKKKKKKRPITDGASSVAPSIESSPAVAATPASSVSNAKTASSPSPAARAIAERALAAPVTNDLVSSSPVQSTTSPNVGKKIDGPAPNGAIGHRRVVSDGEIALRKQCSNRAESLSPTRKAHFSSKAIDLEHGIRHVPLRAPSPAKSALKHSPSASVRGESPLPTEESVASAKKKKNARVSFDEPRDLQPSTLAFMTSIKPAAPSQPAIEDFDDTLKPTPAMPSFSSIRGNKRDTTESMDTSVSTLVNEEPSRDQVVGAVLAQDLATKQATPVPPKVTTVQGSDDILDSASEYEDEPAVKLPERTATKEVGESPLAKFLSKEDVPAIAVQPASPQPETGDAKMLVPGSFPRGSTEVDKAALEAKLAEGKNVGSTEADTHAVAVPQPIELQASPVAAPLSPETQISESEESESDEGLYSDAAEDFSEPEGDGFVSLNAILETPAELNPETPPALAIARADPMVSASSVNPSASDWDAATEYWKSLSAQKRTELESQMRGTKGLPAVGVVSEQDEAAAEPIPAPTPKKKKRTKENIAPVAAAAVPAVAAAPVLKSAMKKTSAPVQPPAEEKPLKMRKSLRGPAPATARDEEPHHMPSSLRGGDHPAKTKSARRDAAPPVAGLSSSMHAPRESRALKSKTMRGSETPEPVRSRATAPSPAASYTSRPTPTAKPALIRTNSADSDSSFKRARRRPASSAGETSFNLRKSMRGNASTTSVTEERPMSPVKSSRWSIRSSSPARSENRMSMRSSLRGASMDQPRSLRNLPKQKKGGLFGLGNSRRGSQAGSVSDFGSPPPSVSRSRFRDDSDDDDRGNIMSSSVVAPSPARVKPSAFKSRFADDSDDEIASPVVERPAPIFTGVSASEPLSPVRGIPRRRRGTDDSDSTDLEDESDVGAKEGALTAQRNAQQERFERMSKPAVPSPTDVEKSMAASLPGHSTHEGAALSAGTLRGASGEKKGLMASKHAASANRLSSPAPTPAPISISTPPSASRPQQKRRLSGILSFGSKRQGQRSESLPPTSRVYGPPTGTAIANIPSETISVKKSPKLQRRNTPSQGTAYLSAPPVIDTEVPTPTVEWPLPSPQPYSTLPSTDPNRPFSSAGESINLRTTMRRPDVGKRRSTADQTLGNGLASSRYAPARHVGFDQATIGGDDEDVTMSGAGAGANGQVPKVDDSIYGRSGKKKRFMGLRRVFGLRD